MTLPETLVRAIALAVQREGGDMDDVDDLIDAWTRLHTTTQPRVDAMRREARAAPCTRIDGEVADRGDGCRRCYGSRPGSAVNSCGRQGNGVGSRKS
jgi:hypothetical protein